HLERIIKNIDSVYLRRPRGWRDKACEDAHGGGLSGTVWSQKSNNFTLFDLKAHLIERAGTPKTLGQVAGLDHDICSHPRAHSLLTVSLPRLPVGRGKRRNPNDAPVPVKRDSRINFLNTFDFWGIFWP